MAGKRATKIAAMLRHLAAGEDLQDFPGTKYENTALARAAERRGLIIWDREGNRYVLTPAGWSELTPRRFGLPALIVSTAAGAAIGAAALAFLWLPGTKWPAPALGHTAALAAQSPAVVPASVPADAGGRSIAPMSAAPQGAAAPGATVTEPSTAPGNPSEPAQMASQPAAEQPSGEATPAVAKQAAVKKPHRRVARPDRYNPFGNPWRAREPAHTRYGQGSWYTYR
jgi:hypothetical protein